MKDCQHFHHLWKNSSLPRSRWILQSPPKKQSSNKLANQVEGGKDKLVEPISTASTLLVLQGSGYVSSSSSTSRLVLHTVQIFSIITKSIFSGKSFQLGKLTFLPVRTISRSPPRLPLSFTGSQLAIIFGNDGSVEVLYFIHLLTI